MTLLSVVVGYDFSDPIYSKSKVGFIWRDFVWFWGDMWYVVDSVLSTELLEALEDEEIDANVPVNRARRENSIAQDEEKRCKPRRSGWMCCRDQIERSDTHDKLKEMKKQCYQEIRANHEDAEPFDMFSCERLKRIKQDTECAKECIAKKLEFVSFPKFNSKISIVLRWFHLMHVYTQIFAAWW